MHTWEIPSTYADVRVEARFLADRVEAEMSEADYDNVFDERVAAALRESRLCEVAIPAEFGGRAERVDPVAVCVVREAFMSRSAHLDAMFSMQGIGSHAMSAAGSASVRESWLPGIGRLDVIPALGLTEPSVGSDLKAITTRVTEQDGRLVLEGEKSYISNAGAAHVYTVLAREADGYSLVVVPAETEGLTGTSGPDLLAPAVIGSLSFDGVNLPLDARVGLPGEAFDLVLSTLSVYRVSMAAAAVGLAQGVLEEAVTHAQQRVAFGRPLSRNGVVAQMIAECWTELEMSRLLTYRAAELARDNPGGSTLHFSSMAKMGATEMAARVVDRSMQMMGRFCLENDRRVARMYRHVRPMRIAEGSSEILRLGIARAYCDELDRVR